MLAIFFVTILFAQIDVKENFLINEAIDTAMKGENPSIEEIGKIDQRNLTYRVDTMNDLETWFDYNFKRQFQDNYYEGFPKPNRTSGGIPNLNYLVSSMRFTQRRITLEKNDDPQTQDYIEYRWSSPGLLSDDSPSDHDDKSPFKTEFGTV